MIDRSFVFSACAIAALTNEVAAAPAIPSPESPPVTVGVAATYYSNIASSSAAIAAARGLKQADEVYTPTVDLNFVEPMGGISFFVAGQAGYDFHQQNSVLNRERINLQAGAQAQLGACESTAIGSYGRFQSDLADLILGPIKNTQEVSSEELDATCDQSGRFAPSATFLHTDSDNSAAQYKSTDYNSNEAKASLAYKAGSLGAISLFGQFTETNYPNRIFLLAIGPRSDGYNLYAGGIHYERNIGSKFEFGASISETSLVTKNNIGSDFNGITYDATLAYHPTARLNVNLEASRKALPAIYLGAAYSVSEQYSAAADYLLSSRLTAKISASQTDSTYRGAALIAGVDLSSQTFRSFNGTLAYNVSPTFSVSLTAGQDQRHANVIGYSYSGARVGLSVSKAF